MRNPSGIIFETNLATGNVKEYDTYHCGHCNRHSILWQHQSSLGFFCSHCAKTICPQCAKKGDCDPLTKKLERWAATNPLFQNIKEI